MRWSPEAIASVVNGSVVLLLPITCGALGALVSGSDHSVSAHAPGWSPVTEAVSFAAFVLVYASLMLPLALIAAGVTWIYARRRIESGDAGWMGVAWAGACGLGIAFLVLLPGTLRRPFEAPPYLIVYGGGALILGLIVGLILRTTALIVLRLAGAGPPDNHLHIA